MTTQPMTVRALGRATLARQLLLRRSPMKTEEALTHLLGLQAQEVRPPYLALAARLDGFTPADLSDALESRRAARLVTMRSTIHLHTAQDCMTLRPLVQPARERELRMFRKGLLGVDLDRLKALTRTYVEEEPRTPKQIRELLLAEWPDADPQSLSIAARCALPLVQATPRGLWRRSGGVRLTTAEHWLDRPVAEDATDAGEASAPAPDATVLRYLGAFGPASVKDFQQWSGLTRTKAAFDRLRPQLVTFRDEHGVELFDLPDAPRPDEDTPAPPRLLAEFDNLLLSHADRTRVVHAADRGRNWQVNTAYLTFLVDGMLAGLWTLKESDAGSVLTLEPFGRLGRAQREELVAEAEHTAAVLEAPGPVRVDFGTVRT
ncbi:winged helix DNA-binding domain-containing protein [Streptomyces sp. VRA16 Mangrove soil]|uniref:winged helix DNA-binding domain-containing protein n=1 Tax=Streptomyces sp. VRA16 Mangrove soil TaxID=2817434 RepID=UPI001A9F826F|nr:winged helix DNA-binding domain-containing protein [Streptomyces sp. VRA16 Mangrove soil]MBO1331335.1 AlkZ family DNA glycosylase [Streptomyces sp. VRA16 Mangrove soil]